jgi:hypothetical protein
MKLHHAEIWSSVKPMSVKNTSNLALRPPSGKTLLPDLTCSVGTVDWLKGVLAQELAYGYDIENCLTEFKGEPILV